MQPLSVREVQMWLTEPSKSAQFCQSGGLLSILRAVKNGNLTISVCKLSKSLSHVLPIASVDEVIRNNEYGNKTSAPKLMRARACKRVSPLSRPRRVSSRSARAPSAISTAFAWAPRLKTTPPFSPSVSPEMSP